MNGREKLESKERYSCPCKRPWRPIGLSDAEASTFSLDNRLTNGPKLSALRSGRPLPPATQEDSWCSFLLETESTPGP
jgi:hypothetical protein